MKRVRAWLCRKRSQLIRWSLMAAVLSPMAAWSISRAFAVDARSIIVVIGGALFAVWRPYRDTWLRQRCSARTATCASH